MADPATHVPQEAIADVCRRWKIREPALFGSVLRDDFGPESDVDVLVTFERGVHHGIDEYIAMHEQLQSLFGRPVDIVNKRTLRNPYLRHRVLTARRILHAA